MEGSQCCLGLAKSKGRLAQVLRCMNLLSTTRQAAPPSPGSSGDKPTAGQARDHRAPSLATVNCKCLGRCRGAGDAESDFSESSLQPFNREVSKEQARITLVLSLCFVLQMDRWTKVFEFNVSRHWWGNRGKTPSTNPAEQFLCQDSVTDARGIISAGPFIILFSEAFLKLPTSMNNCTNS